MEALIGIIIGVIATIVVSRYYFKRTVNKQLTPYLTLSTRIFAGIEETVRQELKFTFRGTEVSDLHQLEFLIANDGERAVSNPIEPLTLEFPKEVQVLDASILHRHPSSLKVEISEVELTNNKKGLAFQFPLLNKGDFFLVKLLLSGSVKWGSLIFNILANDLPRRIRPKLLPVMGTGNQKFKVEWSSLVAGIIILIFSASIIYTLILLYPHRPDLFPYPWQSFTPSFLSILLIVIWAAGIFIFTIVGLVLSFGMGFEGFFSRHPRFPIPDEFRHRGFRFSHMAAERLMEFDVEFDEEEQKKEQKEEKLDSK
jgi:hypothetical protein